MHFGYSIRVYCGFELKWLRLRTSLFRGADDSNVVQLDYCSKVQMYIEVRSRMTMDGR